VVCLFLDLIRSFWSVWQGGSIRRWVDLFTVAGAKRGGILLSTESAAPVVVGHAIGATNGFVQPGAFAALPFFAGTTVSNVLPIAGGSTRVGVGRPILTANRFEDLGTITLDDVGATITADIAVVR
jgi:hypothetical protein